MKRPLCFTSALFTSLLSVSANGDATATQQCADAYVKAQILRNDHKLVEAQDVLRVCAQPSCKSFIVKDCSAWLDIVQPSVPAVVPIAVDETGNALFDIKVSMDAAPLLVALDGRSVEVDPGPHIFEFEAPDGRKADTTVIVPEGDKHVRVAVTFPRALARTPAPAASTTATPSVAAPSPLAIAPVAGTADVHVTPRESSHATISWKRVGLAVAGAGALGVGTGAFFGFDALSKRNAAGCDSREVCPSNAARDELNAARRSGDLATGFLVMGGALAASGATLWLFAPSDSRRMAIRVGTERCGIVVNGAW